MANETQHTDFDDLIAKYLAGETDSGETVKLEQWVAVSDDNRHRYFEMKNAWQNATQKPAVNVEQEWKKIKKKLFSAGKTISMNQSAGKKSKLRFITRIAAAVVILVAFGYAAFYLFDGNTVTTVAANNVVNITLNDGSHVALNRDSEITYSKSFNNDQRVVSLKGEAFFEVTKDKSRPFVIETDQLKIEVLGTSFFVNVRQTNVADEVVVSSGRVMVAAIESKPVVLAAGQKAVFHKKAGLLSRSENVAQNYLSWKTGKLIFEDVPLVQVVLELSRAYHTEVELGNKALRVCKLNAVFEGQSLEDVIIIICETLGLDYQKTGDKYIITGNACR